MTLIIGIDPGSRVTGYGVIAVAGSRQRYMASGCIKTAHKSELPQRLEEIFSGVSQVLEEYPPDELAIERVFVGKSAESALKLGHARGVAMLAATLKGIPIFEYEARKIKQAVVGNGAASKNQVQYMVKKLLGLPGYPQKDAADALAIALTHINTQFIIERMGGCPRTFRRGRLID